MGLGGDLMMMGLALAGGYILFYHVIPNLPQQATAQGGGTTEQGIAPTVDPATGEWIWPWDDRYDAAPTPAPSGGTFTPALPQIPARVVTTPAPKATNNAPRPTPFAPVAPKPVQGISGVVAPRQTGIQPRQISANCRQAANGQYCWKSGTNAGIREVCLGGSCATARQYFLQRYAAPAPKPAPKKINPPAVFGSNCGGTICVSMYNAAHQRAWRCSTKCKSWYAGTAYRCKGALASQIPIGNHCNP